MVLPFSRHNWPFEIALFCYAFSFGRPRVASGEFRYNRSSGFGAVFGAILMIAVAELTAGHILLRMWSQTAAFIHLALSAYGVLWIVGDFRAMSRRPHIVTPEGIRIRLGLRWDVYVKWEDVVAVRRTRRGARESGRLNTAALGEPTYVLELREPVVAIGRYGIKRSVTRIGIVVDDRAAFVDCLRRRTIVVF